MPLAVPAMPAPVLPDSSVLDQNFNIPIPEPTQSSEPLRPGSETDKLKESEKLAMQQKMVMADFEKSLMGLIAKQRNPNVADLSLNDAVQIALRQNPDILNAIQQIRLTRGQLIEVVAQAVPQIGISSGYNQNAESLNPQRSSGPTKLTIPNPSGPPTVLEFPNQNPASQNQTWNIQFQATQLIFDGGATISGIRAGDSAYQSAFFSLRSTIDVVVSQVISQFYQVVLNRALIVAQQQNVALLEQQVKDQQNRFDAGTVPRFNVLQAEVALANAKPPLIQAENAYRISLYQLVRLLGMDYPRGHPSEVPFNVVGTLGYSPKPIDTDTSIRIAIARNPALKAQRLNILTQAANVNVQFAGYLPTINANVGYQIQNDVTSSNLDDTLTGWFFGATGTWNFWDGGATYGRVAQAKAQVMQSKNTYDNQVRTVVLNVQEAISNLQQAKETIDSQTASVVQATEALRLARERLDAGAGTQLDVLNAQVQLLQSQTNVLQARYDYIAAMAAYDQALSLDTQYVETFDDPLIRPLNPQSLSRAETKKFQKVTEPEKPQPPLPRQMRKDDPIAPILEGKPSPTPKKKVKGGLNK
jgi:TolC family type I secretion outer membrane protein